MQARDLPFAKIINGTTQFIIPVFQRDYSWTEVQCEQLWKDILKAAREPDSRGHFIGSVVYVSAGDNSAGLTRWLLIDGQQRVTTLTLLMAALRDHIVQKGWKGGENSPSPARIEAYFLKNIHEEGARKPKLELRRHDMETLRAILDSAEMPAQVSSRIRDNYDFFLNQMVGTDPDEVYRGLGKLVVVEVTLDGTDDPQAIFESLNSTGVDLSQSDLIRNYLLMRLPERKQTELYELFWCKLEALFRGSEKAFDAFLRDYLAFKTRAGKQERADQVYEAFRRHFAFLQESAGGLEPLLAEILRLGRHHASFSASASVNPQCSDDIACLRRLADAPAMLVMRILDCHAHSGTLSVEELRTAFRLIESYLFRRAICGEQTRNYWIIFSTLAYRITDSQPLEDLKVGLARLRDSARFPRNDEFHRELLTRDVYGLRVCSYLLERLENHGSREPTNTATYSIEHILPQNERLPEPWQAMLGPDWKQVQATWLHRLGNLTLTAYNSFYSDKPFEEKKTVPGGFNESSVRLNKFVREQARWTSAEIEERGRKLADRALEIWSGLIVEPAAIERARLADLRELAQRRDVAKVPMTEAARQLFEALRPGIRAMGPDVLELAENKSVSFHTQGDYFVEVLPRKHGLILLLPLEHVDISDPFELAEDATKYKFFFHAKYEGGVSLKVEREEDIGRALSIVQQAHAAVSSGVAG